MLDISFLYQVVLKKEKMQDEHHRSIQILLINVKKFPTNNSSLEQSGKPAHGRQDGCPRK
jgi:hypothetical protein